MTRSGVVTKLMSERVWEGGSISKVTLTIIKKYLGIYLYIISHKHGKRAATSIKTSYVYL